MSAFRTQEWNIGEGQLKCLHVSHQLYAKLALRGIEPSDYKRRFMMRMPATRRFDTLRTLSLVGLLLVVSGCAGMGTAMFNTVLTDPVEDGILIIGAVIVSTINEQRAKTVHEVHIAGDVEKDGETVRVGFTVIPDDQGYFAIENAPPGNYVLKGASYGLRDVTSALIWHEMKYPTDRWKIVNWSIVPPFTGNVPQTIPNSNVINLGYNIFLTFGDNVGNDNIRLYHRMVIENETFDTPYTFRNPHIEVYFMSRFPESGWVPILRRIQP